jgi:hypothetical protein
MATPCHTPMVQAKSEPSPSQVQAKSEPSAHIVSFSGRQIAMLTETMLLLVETSDFVYFLCLHSLFTSSVIFCLHLMQGRISTVSLGPAVPYHSTSCGRPPLKGPYGRVLGGRLRLFCYPLVHPMPYVVRRVRNTRI